MVVANTEVQLGLLRASDIGRALLQQLVSIEDVRGQRISVISADKIKETITASHIAPDSPYIVHVSCHHLYISWKSACWWEAYELGSPDIAMRETLNALPCTVMRPQPPSAFIKKRGLTVRHPAGQWDPTLLSPKRSNVRLAEPHCDGPPPPPAGVVPRLTRLLAGRTNRGIPCFADRDKASL
jgi:hypothetical protein